MSDSLILICLGGVIAISAIGLLSALFLIKVVLDKNAELVDLLVPEQAYKRDGLKASRQKRDKVDRWNANDPKNADEDANLMM